MEKKVFVILGTAHLSSTPGKRSPDGKFREYAWSREMCKMIKSALEEKGIEAAIDYEGADMPGLTSSQELTKRVKLVNALCAEHGVANCIYVSVHNNAASSNGSWSSARGCSVWIAENASVKSKSLATKIFDEMKSASLLGNRSTPSTKYHAANFYVVKNTACPAVLTENMFQDNKDDVAYLESEAGKRAICDAHVKGIISYIESL